MSAPPLPTATASGVARRVGLVGSFWLAPAVRLAQPSRRVLVLVALQAAPVPRGVVAEQLWPDQPEARGRANLRRALWQLPAGWLRSSGEELVLDAAVDVVAAREFAARALGGQPLTLDEIDILTRDLLPGWHEEWLVAAQEAFRSLRVQALEAACSSLSQSGHHALAVHAGEAAVAAEPLRESAAAALIAALLAQGNRGLARRRYVQLARLLHAELGVQPDPLLTSLLETVVPLDRSA